MTLLAINHGAMGIVMVSSILFLPILTFFSTNTFLVLL